MPQSLATKTISAPDPEKLVPLPREFYRPSAEVVSPLLLGHYLLRRTPEGLCGGPIVETEAYLSNDPSAHGYNNRSARNASMWGQAGHAYVYQIYGLHFCFNAVCRTVDIAEAVLVRAIEPIFGLEAMLARRAVEEKNLTNGPAKFCAAMQINRALDGFDICDAGSALFIAANPDIDEFREARAPVVQTTRIGITKAADWPMRWYLGGSAFVSKRAVKDKSK